MREKGRKWERNRTIEREREKMREKGRKIKERARKWQGKGENEREREKLEEKGRERERENYIEKERKWKRYFLYVTL